MLKPAAMQRIAVVGLKDERRRILSILYDLGVVQIETLSKEASKYVRSDIESSTARDILEELMRIRSLKSALPPEIKEKRRFSSLADLLSTSHSINIDEQVSSLVRNENRFQTRLDELNEWINMVEKLSFVDEDLSIFDLQMAASFFGTLSIDEYEKLSTAMGTLNNVIVYPSGHTEEIPSSKGKKTTATSFVLVVPSDQLEKFGSIIQKSDIRLERIPKLRGRPSVVTAQLRSEKASIEEQIKDINEAKRSLSERYYGAIASVEEQLAIEARKVEITSNLGFTENVFVLEGWIPKRRYSELAHVLQRNSPITNLLKIENEGQPPTLLENPKRLKFFESFIRFYSIPDQAEIEPTLIFAFTFPIFFGLMLGDVGYGLSILGISYWILNRVKHPGKKTLVPRFLRSFALRIFRPSQFQKIAMAMIPGALVGIVFGFIFNEYFGFQLNQYLFDYLNSVGNIGLPANGTFLDPLSTGGLKALLLVSGYIGLFAVSLGLILGILNGYWMHHIRHSFGKLGWLLLAWGVSLIGLILLHHGTASPANIFFDLYVALAVVGLGLIAYGEGTRSLIELPSIISHILSYTRILGILLASVIFAYVIDFLFEGAQSGGVAVAIFGIVILVGGQLFNLVLAMFEPGVQGARLIYVEFFSKFLHGSGRPFTPFKGGRNYTLSEIETIDSDNREAQVGIVGQSGNQPMDARPISIAEK